MDQILIYSSEDGRTKIDVMLEAENLWLNQKQLTELFGKAKGTISEHIKNVFEDGELDKEAIVRFFRTVQPADIVAKAPAKISVKTFEDVKIQLFGFSEQLPLIPQLEHWAMLFGHPSMRNVSRAASYKSLQRPT